MWVLEVVEETKTHRKTCITYGKLDACIQIQVVEPDHGPQGTDEPLRSPESVVIRMDKINGLDGETTRLKE